MSKAVTIRKVGHYHYVIEGQYHIKFMDDDYGMAGSGWYLEEVTAPIPKTYRDFEDVLAIVLEKF